VHDVKVVDVASGSFGKESIGGNPHSGTFNSDPRDAAKNPADLEAQSSFYSAYRSYKENSPHTRNNWVCYDFKEKRIVPTHYTIRTNGQHPNGPHLKLWLVETSVDRKSWRDVARQEGNEQLNGKWFTGTFAAASAASSGW
jgi:hypothetical protein